jgi:hypothetical protein
VQATHRLFASAPLRISVIRPNSLASFSKISTTAVALPVLSSMVSHSPMGDAAVSRAGADCATAGNGAKNARINAAREIQYLPLELMK